MSNHGRVESLLPCHIIRRAAKIESDKTFLQRQSFAVKNIYVSIFIIIIIAGLSQKQNKRKIVQKKINRNNKLTMKISVASVLAVAAVVPSALAFAPVNMGKTSAVIQQSMTPGPRFESKLFMADDEEWSAPKSAMIGGAGVNNAGEPPFEIRGFSLGNVVILSGILITVLSFAEYLSDSGAEGLNVSGLGFVYGIPVFLAGAALKYAEIEPVPVFSTAAGEAIYESKKTETIDKIKQDVTRHRYGDEAHLDTTVKKLGLVVPGKAYPQLQELREEEIDGQLAFTMVWQSVDTPYKMWADERRIKKYETYFGPGVSADVVKIDAEQRLVGIRLTTTSGVEQPEVTTA